jgi:hypothetical protein
MWNFLKAELTENRVMVTRGWGWGFGKWWPKKISVRLEE